MNFIKWMPRPWSLVSTRRELDRLASHMEKMYDSVANEIDAWRRGTAGVYPLINLSEDADNLYLTAELPGLPSESLDLSLQGDNLTLRGERKIPETEQNISYHRREREGGFFRRVITLPVKVDIDRIAATFQDGILVVTMPKAVEAKVRQISVASV